MAEKNNQNQAGEQQQNLSQLLPIRRPGSGYSFQPL